MKRDMELIRKIVLAVEDRDENLIKHRKIEGYSSEQVGYHCHILIQGGLAEGNSYSTNDHRYPYGQPNNLTWNGHEFADLARNQTIWNQTTEIIKKKSDTVTIGVLMQLLAAAAKAAFGLA